MSDVALVVIAKAPVPGRAKTRLCPPCSPEQAAALAAAALTDTLRAVAATPARRRILALDGAWPAPGFEVVPQPGGGLAERIAAALCVAGGPALLVGMDTPQLTPALLERASVRLTDPGVDAVLGPALDGGYWTLGLRRPDRAALQGVPMSSPHTCAAQRARLRELGLTVAWLPPLRDVDTIEDARLVARELPDSRFAAAMSVLPDSANRQHAVPEPAGRGRLQAPNGSRERGTPEPRPAHQRAPS